MLVFDIETNSDQGIDHVTKIHVVAMHDTVRGVDEVYSNDRVEEGIRVLSAADTLCGHNIIGYDLPVIHRLYPQVHLSNNVIDTLVLARLTFSDIKQIDIPLWKKGLLPGKFIGLHSLESYGYRLGILKGKFKDTANWSKWSQEMEDYCVQDVRVTKALLEKLQAHNVSKEAIDLEHAVTKIIDRQIKRGFQFDKKKAEKLYAEVLIPKREELGKQLRHTFGMWWEREGKKEFTPKKDNKKSGYHKGCPFTKIRLIEFNPTSRHHIAKVLMKKGWTPAQWHEDGTPVLDEEVIKALPFEEAPLIAEYLMISKRIGQLAEGKQAWLKLVGADGRIHGNVNPNGAVTGRMIHFNPNVAQTPQVEVPYGKECRELFGVFRKGWKLVGGDASGLELRTLGHYMARFDDGAYVEIILTGDVHTSNQEAGGIDTRRNAKTFIYAFLYGAGDELLGTFVHGGKAAGRALRNRFLNGLPALKRLISAIKQTIKGYKKNGKWVNGRGYLIGLDGRKLKIRSLHSALNLLLQSAGALIMKKALVILDGYLQSLGYFPGEDYEFVANIHDEFQVECKEEIAEEVGKQIVAAIEAAGIHFKLRCPLTGEYKVGTTWADTH